jgi:serine/threonine protein kinase
MGAPNCSTKTQAGFVMGSPWYMAPEVAEGRAADADERTDVYLLGATLYHILTGSVPRQGRSVQEIIVELKTGKLDTNLVAAAKSGGRSEPIDPGVAPHMIDAQSADDNVVAGPAAQAALDKIEPIK